MPFVPSSLGRRRPALVPRGSGTTMELHVSLRKEQMTGISWLSCLHRSDRTSEALRCPGTDYPRKRADRDPSLPGPPVHWAWVACRPALFRARSPVCWFSGKPPTATVDDSPETGAQEKRACSKPTRTVRAADGDGGLHRGPCSPLVPGRQEMGSGDRFPQAAGSRF